MSLRKIVSTISIWLVFSQTALAASPAATPEAKLVEKVIALRGMQLDQDQLQASLQTAIRNYSSSASEGGRQERLSQALIDLGVYTPEQVQSFASDAQAEAARGEIQTQEQLVTEVERLASLHPVGAQFSGACDVMPYVIGTSLVVGALAGVSSFFLGSDGCTARRGNCSDSGSAPVKVLYAGGGLIVLGMIGALIYSQVLPANSCDSDNSSD